MVGHGFSWAQTPRAWLCRHKSYGRWSYQPCEPGLNLSWLVGPWYTTTSYLLFFCWHHDPFFSPLTLSNFFTCTYLYYLVIFVYAGFFHIYNLFTYRTHYLFISLIFCWYGNLCPPLPSFPSPLASFKIKKSCCAAQPYLLCTEKELQINVLTRMTSCDEC